MTCYCMYCIIVKVVKDSAIYVHVCGPFLYQFITSYIGRKMCNIKLNCKYLLVSSIAWPIIWPVRLSGCLKIITRYAVHWELTWPTDLAMTLKQCQKLVPLSPLKLWMFGVQYCMLWNTCINEIACTVHRVGEVLHVTGGVCC